MDATRRILMLTAIFTETWILSLVFFYLAWLYILFGAGILTGVFLLIARRAAVLPERLSFVLVPLATTFFTMLYYTVPSFPSALQVSLCPPEWRMALVTAGVTCAIIGPLISLWGIIHLGRSFGIFVAVRKVVLTGPYRWVRHPMRSEECRVGKEC